MATATEPSVMYEGKVLPVAGLSKELAEGDYNVTLRFGGNGSVERSVTIVPRVAVADITEVITGQFKDWAKTYNDRGFGTISETEIRFLGAYDSDRKKQEQYIASSVFPFIGVYRGHLLARIIKQGSAD